MSYRDAREIEVIAPNLKRRYSGVTSTVLRLVPIQARQIAIAAAGPVLPDGIPRLRLRDLALMPRRGPSGPRVWHARRNIEMLAGLALKHLLRKRLKLIFTSAAQRRHSKHTRRLIGRMDAVVATSSRAAAYLEREAQVIRHGVDTALFSPAPDRAALRRRLGLPEEALLVGCFGRVRPQKGVDLFVDAMLEILPRHPQVQGVIMGGVTPQFEGFVAEQRRKIAEAGLADRLHILPEDSGPSIAPWFQALDLYVAPQRWEGFGLTPLEAMACGVPVVATRVGAFEELVAEGVTGTLVPAEDLPALTEATEAALADPEALATRGRAARQHVLDHFRIEQEAEALIALYRRLLAS
ncbi:glycosyltransferase family 4 protein [Pseudoroseicyclus aestuarii]|uniref:Mannosyltransferase n=1 Tax=Pseudoroseicyclus aestuarii TaxID=1795041 RepID=A0A318SU34_9RHOB|nr:glycosyltransferase family 4 protein [Pseudoroseicyclus aestuarii]PYE85390.1 mannosyltransferase [Pseudoroseicyclus aestuarii]